MSDLSQTSSSERIPWWLWINVLSLDAPLLALLWQAALAQCHRVRLMPGCHIALGLSVWLIYIADRTLDGFREVDATRLSARHAFYRCNRFIFAFFVLPVVLALLVITVLTTIPQAIMWRGLLLGVLVGLYLLLYAVRWNNPRSLITRAAAGSRLLPKELICGCVFALGCSLSVSFFTHDTAAHPLSMEVLLLALLATLNCIAIACYERETDSANDPRAITQVWPQIIRFYPLLLLMLAGVAGLFLRRTLPGGTFRLVLCLLISTGLLGALHVFSRRLSPDLSRVLADAALTTPLWLLIVG